MRGLKLHLADALHDKPQVAPRVGAWIETTKSFIMFLIVCVAPRVGAWIETGRCLWHGIRLRSHPAWVRGLKQSNQTRIMTLRMSHPAWVRGLKLVFHRSTAEAVLVAPRVGAWIETNSCKYKDNGSPVAPRVGAWIETSMAF